MNLNLIKAPRFLLFAGNRTVGNIEVYPKDVVSETQTRQWKAL